MRPHQVPEETAKTDRNAFLRANHRDYVQGNLGPHHNRNRVLQGLGAYSETVHNAIGGASGVQARVTNVNV
eukprot:2669614-Pyramimonas_sp.AAC.1